MLVFYITHWELLIAKATLFSRSLFSCLVVCHTNWIAPKKPSPCVEITGKRQKKFLENSRWYPYRTTRESSTIERTHRWRDNRRPAKERRDGDKWEGAGPRCYVPIGRREERRVVPCGANTRNTKFKFKKRTQTGQDTHANTRTSWERRKHSLEKKKLGQHINTRNKMQSEQHAQNAHTKTNRGKNTHTNKLPTRPDE